MSTRYFVSRFSDGSVSHLARVTETETTLDGEFFVDGRWLQDGSATEYVLDGSLGQEIDAAHADDLVAELSAGASVAALEPQHSDAVRAALAALLPSGAPALPDPVPARGTLTGDGWTITYVVGVGGRPGLDVFAQHRFSPPVHAHVDADGTATVLDSIQYEYGYDPDVPGDREAAEARMQEHNREVREELARKQLI